MSYFSELEKLIYRNEDPDKYKEYKVITEKILENLKVECE